MSPEIRKKMSSWRGKVSRFYIIFSSRNSAKNAGRSSKNAGKTAKCWISRTIAGWLTPMKFQRHASSCRSFSGPALSTMSINIEAYSQAKAEIVSTFAHGYDIVCMQETHIGPEHCRPSIYGMKLIAEIRHRKYVSAVYAKPTLNIEEVHTEVIHRSS